MSAKVKTTQTVSMGTRKDGTSVTVDLVKCIAAGPCAIAAAKTFGIREEDGKAIILDPDGDTVEAIMEAARSCPVKAIIVKDKKGKQQYP